MKDSTINKKTLYYTIGVLLIFVGWYLISAVVNNSGIFPTINETFNDLISVLKKRQTYSILLFTLYKIFITTLISLAIGILLSIISLINYRIELIIKPLISLMKVIPIASIAVVILTMFFKQQVRYIGTMVVTSFVMIPIIYEGILTSFKNIDKNIIDATKLISNVNIKVVQNVYIPITAPYILSSIMQSFGIGLKVMVMSELILNPNDSIGKIIGEYQSYGELSMVFAWTIVMIVFVIIIDVILSRAQLKKLV